MIMNANADWATKIWSPVLYNYRIDLKEIHAPLGWKDPERVLINGDPGKFEGNYINDLLLEIIREIEKYPDHTFFMQTRFPEKMKESLRHCTGDKPYPSNLWVGVIANNQEEVDSGIPILLSIPAAGYFVNAGYMIGLISFRWKSYCHEATGETYREYLKRKGSVDHLESLRMIDWVICGSSVGGLETWVSDLLKECFMARVPFFGTNFPDGKEISIRQIPKNI